VDKRRSAHNVSEVMNLIGDVKGKVAVLVDDMIDTAGTITNAAKVLVQGSRMTSCAHQLWYQFGAPSAFVDALIGKA
jgi:ribose-phosphate pyrophosphokinase